MGLVKPARYIGAPTCDFGRIEQLRQPACNSRASESNRPAEPNAKRKRPEDRACQEVTVAERGEMLLGCPRCCKKKTVALGKRSEAFVGD